MKVKSQIEILKIDFFCLFTIIIPFLFGCNYRPVNPFSAQIDDQAGTNRLILAYLPVRTNSGTVWFEFDSLVWQIKTHSNWADKIVITKAQFEAKSHNPQWVAEIHSINGDTGNALLKVAEVFPETNNGATCVYSWREWNLVNNAEVRLLKICKEPFEPYEGQRIKFVK